MPRFWGLGHNAAHPCIHYFIIRDFSPVFSVDNSTENLTLFVGVLYLCYMAKENNNKVTLESLAGMVNRRFDEMASKEDLKAFATKEDLKKFEQKLEHKMDVGFIGVNARIDLIREDISDLPTIREELDDFRHRLGRVEQKVGLVK